ncbi:helix-turn-helix domain-containing protein [Muricoccus radiodurans]|uniref:helix-turn-helix domain-containing protein n=1 Tax=Muricoccus radiodurans TaxID=2231721 RepID=UPI003CFBA328
MPSRSRSGPVVETFHTTDPDAFRVPAQGGLRHHLVLRGPGPFEAWRNRVVAEDLIVSRGRVAPDVTQHTGTGRYAIFTLVAAGGPPSIMQGQPLRADQIAWCRPEAEIHAQTPSGVAWWNLCLPDKSLEPAWIALFGSPPPPWRLSVRLAPLANSRRASLIAGLSAALANPASIGPTLRDGLLRLALEAFATADREEEAAGTEAAARRAAVVDALVALADRSKEPRSVLSVCAELGVPVRTLNLCCTTLLGMAAGQYLRRRRLQRSYADLRAGMVTSVTEAATRHGFWELGRFAHDYRALFGERPSDTLRRTTEQKA